MSGAADPAADRGLTHHEPPPADADLAKFPPATVQGVWFRAHVERSRTGDRGCWWFSSAGAPADKFGRFDLPAPRGTCYLANTEEGAARERVGPQLRKSHGKESVLDSVLTDDEGLPVVVTQVDLAPVRAANVAVKPAQGWVNRSLWSGTGIYATTQAWAAAFDAAGFEGIRYPPRFTLGTSARALAVFGKEKAPKPARKIVSTRPVGDVLEENGVRVVSPPFTAPTTVPGATAPPPL